MADAEAVAEFVANHPARVDLVRRRIVGENETPPTGRRSC